MSASGCSTGAPGNARCPRCGAGFVCGAAIGGAGAGAGELACACAGVALDDTLRQQLAARWHGCLCLSCLRALQQAHKSAAQTPAAAGGSAAGVLKTAPGPAL